MGWRDPARERPGRQATRAGDAPPWPPIAQTQLRVGFYSEQSLRHNQAEEGAIALRENVLCEPRCGFRDAIRKKPKSLPMRPLPLLFGSCFTYHGGRPK